MSQDRFEKEVQSQEWPIPRTPEDRAAMRRRFEKEGEKLHRAMKQAGAARFHKRRVMK